MFLFEIEAAPRVSVQSSAAREPCLRKDKCIAEEVHLDVGIPTNVRGYERLRV